MDDSLEALLEKATNPKNKYEDWEFIMAFCDRVNTEAEGPQTALRIIVPKMRHENEKVSLLSLTLLEACVKNCGQRFHQELGKFRFLNELIRMVSPKYLGNQTTPAVRTKITDLLYNWKVGLPLEPKIAEAFQMLKKEGLAFDESKPADKTLESSPPKPRIALIEDPKQSEVLRRLLASKSPEDLRAANRLIREMVRRDEKRMEKLQKRLEELELISNNTKLLNELLAHYGPASGEQEKLLIKELHASLDRMRPNLFRMASELKQNEEGMSEILRLNDSLIRVMDHYKRVMGDDDAETAPTTSTSPTTASNVATASASDSATAQSLTSTSTGAGAMPSATGGSDILIDLADLNFGSTPSSSQDIANTSTSSSLLDDLGLLNISMPPQSTTPNFSTITIPPLLTSPPVSQPVPLGLPSQQQPPLAQQLQQQPFPLLTAPSTSSSLTSPPLFTIPPPPQGAPFIPISRITQQLPPSTSAATQPAAAPVLGASLLGGIGSFTLNATPFQTQPGGPAMKIQPVSPLGSTGLAPLAGTSGVQVDPLAVLNDLFVPQETIQPGSQPPLQVMNKNGITVTFHFAKNTPAPSVAVVVISIISTGASPVTNFQFQAAVPKVMRVKLQPPKGTELAPYNPVLPPSSISQIMLLANPTKAKIRLKYRISYNQNGQEVVEMGEASDFPSV